MCSSDLALLFPPYHRTDRGVRGIFYGMNGWMDGWMEVGSLQYVGGTSGCRVVCLGRGPLASSEHEMRDWRVGSLKRRRKEKEGGPRHKSHAL